MTRWILAVCALSMAASFACGGGGSLDGPNDIGVPSDQSADPGVEPDVTDVGLPDALETGPEDVHQPPDDPGDTGTEDPGTPELPGDLPGEDTVVTEVQTEVVESCEVQPALEPFSIHLQFPDPMEMKQVLSGEALVTFVGPYCCDAPWDWEIHFQLPEVRGELVVQTMLPYQYRIPVETGETVTLFAEREMPWWQNTYLAVWGADKHLRFFLYDGDGLSMPAECSAEMGACPGVKLLDTDCPGVPETCGDAVHPPVEFNGSWGSGNFVVEQGSFMTEMAAEGTFKFFNAKSRKNVTMLCDDYPDTWISAFFADNFPVSQCVCNDKFDCSIHDVCEMEAHRCVVNKCMLKKCEEGEWCDPYTGQCYLPPPGVLYSCETTADCPGSDGCGMVCNPYLGYCQTGSCCVMDCMGNCSDLMQTCYLCLSDCDCFGPGGTCDLDTFQCTAGCDVSKFNFDQSNAPAYEFYEVCVPKDLDGPLMVLKDIDPSIYCGVSGFFAGCDTDTETGCHGDLAYDAPGSKFISDGKWKQLCAISLLDFVSKIGGGHYL